jgi:ABC-type glycerol-3-phosphate transport system permease component
VQSRSVYRCLYPSIFPWRIRFQIECLSVLEYLLGVTLTNDQEVRTLPVLLAGAFGGMGQWAWPRIAAVYVIAIAIAPGLAPFALSQRWYMQGLQEGALKY